jgi:outer membrane protein TolC
MSLFSVLHVWRSAFALALSASVVSAWAQPLTLAEALRLAEKRAPSVSAAEAAARGARETAVSAGQLPDPVLRAGLDNVPVTGPDQFSLDRDFMTMRRIGVMQEYVSSAKRNARQERGEREARRFTAEAQMSLTDVRTEVAAAWYDRYFAQKALGPQQGLVDEVAVQRRAIQGQMAGGKASAADALMLDVLLAQSRDRVTTARRQDQVAAVKLARWLGEDASRPLAGDGEIPNQDAALTLPEHDVHTIAHLRVLASELDVAEAAVQVAEEERTPNWTWEVAYQQRGPSYSNMVSVGVSVPLPIARSERQDRDLAARLAQRDQARDQLEDARRRHTAEFNAMRLEWQALRERERDLEATLLPVVRQRTEALLAGYSSGQVSLLNVLEARRAEVDARVQVLDLERDAARLWAKLRYTYLDSAGAKP